jgi:hypothetical protein
VTVYKGHQSQIQNESGIYRQCKERESKWDMFLLDHYISVQTQMGSHPHRF